MFYRLQFFYAADDGGAFSDADDLSEDTETVDPDSGWSIDYSTDDDGNWSWTATDEDGNTYTFTDDGWVSDNPSTETHEETHAVDIDDVTDDMLDDGYSSDDIESIDEDGTIHYEDGHSSQAGAATVTETVVTEAPPTVVEVPQTLLDLLPTDAKANLANAMSKNGDTKAAQALQVSAAKEALTKAGIDKSSVNQLIQQGLGRGTSKQALDEKQALSNYLNSGNLAAAAQLLGMDARTFEAQYSSGKLTLDDMTSKIDDKYPNGPVDPAAQAMLGALGIGEPNEAFNKAYAENLAKGMDPGRAYDAALDAAGIAPTEWMNQAIKDSAMVIGTVLTGGLTPAISELAAISDVASGIVSALSGASTLATTLGVAAAPLVLMTNDKSGSGVGTGTTTAASSTPTTAVGTGTTTADKDSAANTSSAIVSGTTADTRGSGSGNATVGGKSSNYNPFDVITPDFSSFGIGAQNTISGEGMGSGTAANTTTDEEPKANEGINLSDTDDGNDDWGGNTVSGGTGDDGRPTNNPNAGGSETTEGIKNDVNGNPIDFNVNTTRIGFSDDPNKANYDERDAKKWNRGMEDLSLNVVSDERCKSFISNSYKNDPVMQRWSRRVIEITTNPDGSITKTETIEGE